MNKKNRLLQSFFCLILVLGLLSMGLAHSVKPTEAQDTVTLQFGSTAWSPDGKMIAAAGTYGKTYVWDTDLNPLLELAAPIEGPMAAVAWSPDGSRLASAGWDGIIRV